MKTICLFCFSIIGLQLLHAQRFSLAAGMNYDLFTSTYGSADAVNIMCHPRLVLNPASRNVHISFSAPFTFGKIVSSSRNPNPYLIELPIALELRLFPKGSKNDDTRRNYSSFAGFGVSRIKNVERDIEGITLLNAYAGVRISALELKVIYGGNYIQPGSYNRLSFGLAYVLR
jgi:hypothetical protein